MTEPWSETPDDVEELPADTGDDIPGELDTEPDPGLDSDDVSSAAAADAGIPDEPDIFVEEIEAETVGGTDGHAVAEVPATGDARVDEVLGALGGIENRPLAEHVGVYDEVHRGLQDALANLDQG